MVKKKRLNEYKKKRKVLRKDTLVALARLYGVCIGEFIEDQHLDYIHCAKNEIKLIQTLRNHPEFDLKTIYAVLNQENKKARLIKEIITNVLKLPIDTLKDYSNLTKNIVDSLQLREGNHNEKSNIDPVSH